MVQNWNKAKCFQREILDWKTLEWCEHDLPLEAGHVFRTGSVEEDSNSTCCYSLIPTMYAVLGRNV